MPQQTSPEYLIRVIFNLDYKTVFMIGKEQDCREGFPHSFLCVLFKHYVEM